jgi:hypothetical protein
MAHDNPEDKTPDDKTKKTLFHGCHAVVDAVYLEQYKIYLELLDKISDRRQNSNSFFLGINTGLCAVVGYLFSKDAAPELRPLLWLIPVAGILLSYFWLRLVRSYRDLNTAKFKVIHLMEERLPLSPYKAEWIALGEGKDSKLYTPFTHLEIWVPRCFVIMHFGLLLYLLPWRAIAHAVNSICS